MYKDNNYYDSVFTADREVAHTFATTTDLNSKDCTEVFYRYPEFNEAIKEHMDLSHRETRRTLLAMNEEAQNTMLTSLTSKLYDNIVNKIDDIDYGDIPSTKGDITKLPNYDKITDCIEVLRNLLKEYRQDTAPVEDIALAVSNIQSRKDMFERAFRYNCELPMVMYSNTVLAIISGISYMIATTVEFVKTPKQESFSITLDKVAFGKSRDHMLYRTLKKFNDSCKSGEFDKAMEYIIQHRIKHGFTEGAALPGFGTALAAKAAVAAKPIIVAGLAIGAVLLVIYMLRELVFLFYYTKMRVSEFFDIQADLLQMNVYNLESNEMKDADEKEKIVSRQLKIVEFFRKAANKFAINGKKAEVEADKEFKENKRKYKIDEVIDEIPAGTSALF